MSDKRAALKVFTSFALVVLCAVGMYRLLEATGPSSRVAVALGVFAVLGIAAAWRGVVYLRYLRTGAKP